VSVFERVFGPRYPVLRRAIVNLKSGASIRGAVWGRRDGWLVLRNAEMLKSRGEVVQMDGEVAVLLTEIEFLQVVG
jgi:hypothetical protein